MSLLEELKERHDKLRAKLKEIEDYEEKVCHELDDLNTAIAALEMEADLQADDVRGILTPAPEGRDGSYSQGAGETEAGPVPSAFEQGRTLDDFDEGANDARNGICRVVSSGRYREGYRSVMEATYGEVMGVESGKVELPQGFIPWSGGECPVEPNQCVEVIRRNGTRDSGSLLLGWYRAGAAMGCGGLGKDYDIVAYRLVADSPADEGKAEGETARDVVRIDQPTPQKKLEECGS